MVKLKVWLVLILLWVIIGSTYIAIKIAIDTIPPFLMSGIRYVLSGTLLILVYIQFLSILLLPTMSNLQYVFYFCYLVNFSVTDPTASSNVFDASSLSAIFMLDIIRLAPVNLTA